MFPDNICQNIDILVVINVQKNNFGFHSNQKTQGKKHQVNNLNFKYQVCQIELRHLNTFLQFRLLFHKPHCNIYQLALALYHFLHVVRITFFFIVYFRHIGLRIFDKLGLFYFHNLVTLLLGRFPLTGYWVACYICSLALLTSLTCSTVLHL